MNPPSLETKPKYIYKPLRAPPPAPPLKLPPLSDSNATIAVDINQHKSSSIEQSKDVENDLGTPTLVSLLQNDKHGGELVYPPKHARKPREVFSARNADGSITTTTVIPPHSSVEVGPGTHEILARLNDLPPLKIRADGTHYVDHDVPAFKLDLTIPKPTNYNAVMFQMYTRFRFTTKTEKKKKRRLVVSNLIEKSKSAAIRSCFFESHPNPASTIIITAPTWSIFFDPDTFNNIHSRPGYFENFPKEELLHRTLCLKTFEEHQTTPRLEPAEAADKPYGPGIIAADDPDTGAVAEHPKYVQLRANLRSDNAMHKRPDVPRNGYRGGKAVWPLWNNNSRAEQSRRWLQMVKALTIEWDEAMAQDRGIDSTIYSVEKLVDQDLRAVMKMRSVPRETKDRDDNDEHGRIVPVRENKGGSRARRRYTAVPSNTPQTTDAISNDNPNQAVPRGEDVSEQVHGLCKLDEDIESLVQAFQSL